MNLLDSYQTYFAQLWPILRDMSARGIPISNSRREELRQLIERDVLRVDNEIRAMVPPEVLSMKQKNGYKMPPILECETCHWKGRTDHICMGASENDEVALKQIPYTKLAALNGLVQREVIITGDQEKCSCSKKSRQNCPVCLGTGIVPAGTVQLRWAAPVEFNPNSRPQVIRFMKYLKHPIPKSAKKVDANGDAADTTEVKELERLYAKTKHPIYPLLIEKRQLTKMMGTYVEGWMPSKDGRIHTTFTFQTATWQLSSRSPNLQNGLKRGRSDDQKLRVDAFNRMQQAEPGHILINLDYKSFHAQTTACEAGLPDYLRLAKIDIHSFTTCHFIKHSERHNLLQMGDNDLRAFFNELKRDSRIWTNELTFKEIRNGKTKAAGLGIGFGMRAAKLYKMYKEDFASPKEAESLWNLIMHELFPGLYKWQESVKKKAAEEGRLVGRFGAIRHFYDVQHWDRGQQKWSGGDQAEAAIAFLPAANAFGMIRWAMLRLRERGLDTRYELINTIHDSLTLHPFIEEAQEAIDQFRPIMESPCPMMIYPGVTGGEGLSVEVESGIGNSMDEVK